jgi:hypothetical protein
MDIVADYAHAYGGVPRAEQTWHEVLALVARVRRFDLRQALAVEHGTRWAQPVDPKWQGVAAMEAAKRQRIAYPHDEDA